MVTKLARTVPLSVMLAAGLMLSLPACASSHGRGWDDYGGNRGRSGVIDGEVRSVDQRRGRITIREYRGRSHELHFDNRTRVQDGRRRYSINALSRGDRVRVRVTYDRRGTPWVDRIEVRDGRQDRRASSRRVIRIDGRIAWIDSRRRSFTIEQGRSGRITVMVPGRIDRGDSRRLERLRKGDRVRIEARELSRGSVELIRFR